MNRQRATSEPRVVDLFAGAGGWEEGLRGLGHETVGIDNDPWACSTACAAGHRRVQASVSDLNPRDFAPIVGLVGSPPCQAYSTGGKKLGRLDKPRVMRCAKELAAGEDARARHAKACRDGRSLLTVEPLRWTLALRPRWIALEQVPPVIELWELFAALLGEHGYHSAAGVLSAERYGIPQTRRRAFLIASLDGPVALPDQSHRSFNSRRPDELADDERGLLPWVSMAQALEWGDTTLLGFDSEQSHTRVRRVAEPATTMRASGSGVWVARPRGGATTSTPAGYDSRAQTNARVRLMGEPAPTLTANGLSKRTALWADTTTTTLGRANAAKRARRITIEQATVLQGFVADYPWQGSRTRRFQQIGNAVCPPLARRVVIEAMRPTRAAQR
jgi:DNA (cytosine-5)-methyltransferase 1